MRRAFFDQLILVMLKFSDRKKLPPRNKENKHQTINMDNEEGGVAEEQHFGSQFLLDHFFLVWFGFVLFFNLHQKCIFEKATFFFIFSLLR